MTDNSLIPARTLPPLIRNFCFFTKQDFADFIQRAADVISGELDKTLEIEIDVAGFDTPFRAAEDLTENISNTEWLKLKSFSIRFVADEDTYHPVAEMKFGMPYTARGTDKPSPAGFVFSIKTGTTSQKVAVKEGISVLVEDYKRHPLPLIVYITLGTLGTALMSTVTYLILKKHFGFHWDRHSLNTTILLSALGGFIVSALATSYAYPVFETLNSEDKFRLKTMKHLISYFFTLYGLGLAIVALI